MKKHAFILSAVALLALSFSSCKKDYTCECSFDDGMGGGTSTYKFEYGKQKKKEAEDACDEQESAYKQIDSSASCELK